MLKTGVSFWSLSLFLGVFDSHYCYYFFSVSTGNQTCGC